MSGAEGGRGTAATYSPALRCSTIGAGGLNFSVRDGKRWGPAAVAAVCVATDNDEGHGENTGRGHTARRGAEAASGGRGYGAISIARLRASPPVHLRPIHVIVSDGPVRPNLAAGFALRCLQRLSTPDAATLPCTWRYNRLTGGRSGTVLSY